MKQGRGLLKSNVRHSAHGLPRALLCPPIGLTGFMVEVASVKPFEDFAMVYAEIRRHEFLFDVEQTLRKARKLWPRKRMPGDCNPLRPVADPKSPNQTGLSPAIWTRRMIRSCPTTSFTARCFVQRLSQKATDPSCHRKRHVNSGRWPHSISQSRRGLLSPSVMFSKPTV